MARDAIVTADAQIVRVTGYQVRDVLRRYGMRAVPVMGAWVLDRKHLPRVLAALDRERYAVQFEDLVPPVVTRKPVQPISSAEAAMW